MQENSYYDKSLVEHQAKTGHHRDVIGGMWDAIGTLQFEFLVAHDLLPQHRLIDVDCGSLRGGVHFAHYLDRGYYYGIDLNESPIDAGYELEFKPMGLDSRIPRSKFHATADFDFSPFDKPFDFALALSVFTHLTLNSIRICLEHLAPCMTPGGTFFATVFSADPKLPTWTPVLHQPGGITTYGDRDPYHYRKEDLAYIASVSGWTAEWFGAFNHPRDQQMVCFRIA